MKPTVSRQVERGKTKLEISQRVEIDTTPRSPDSSVCSASVGISPVVTPDGDRVALGIHNMLK